MRIVLLACLSAFALAACGIKGPLYIAKPIPAPPPAAAASSASAPAAIQPDSSKAPSTVPTQP